MVAQQQNIVVGNVGYTIAKHGNSRFWQVLDVDGELVCVTVYRRGAVEVVRRLTLI